MARTIAVKPLPTHRRIRFANKGQNMSYLRLLASISFLLIPNFAAAQSSLEGTWNVTFSTRDAETRQAVVKITDAEGTWTTYAQQWKAKNDPCVGRAFPLAVTVGGQSRLPLKALG